MSQLEIWIGSAAQNPWFVVIASLCSIISLLVAAWTWWNTSKLSKRFLSIVRLPQTNRQLGRASDNLYKFVQDFDANRTEINTRLGEILGTLNALRPKLPKNVRSNVESFTASTNQFLWPRSNWMLRLVGLRSNPTSNESKQDQCYAILTQLSQLRQELKELEKDQRWGSTV